VGAADPALHESPTNGHVVNQGCCPEKLFFHRSTIRGRRPTPPSTMFILHDNRRSSPSASAAGARSRPLPLSEHRGIWRAPVGAHQYKIGSDHTLPLRTPLGYEPGCLDSKSQRKREAPVRSRPHGCVPQTANGPRTRQCKRTKPASERSRS
jgi:hypothetical protein